MYKKTMVRGLMAVAALAATQLGRSAMAQVILPTQAQVQALGATQYQILLVTSGGTTATSTNPSFV